MAVIGSAIAIEVSEDGPSVGAHSGGEYLAHVSIYGLVGLFLDLLFAAAFLSDRE